MLDLDDTRWSELRHAYGSAEDVPDMIRGLPGTLGDMWGALLHQGDVSEAAYFVVPHLVAHLGEDTLPDPHRQEVFSFLALVCMEDGAVRAETPGYETALERARALVLEDLVARPGLALSLLTLLAAVTGHTQEARRLGSLLVQEELPLTCPHCWTHLVAEPVSTGWRLTKGLEFR